ncbi:MAG: 5'/3'-nucleotidase SurE, partial [Bacteroidota bacterium]|nr:5'/3'-nucleotidase SurE [Bacteroidota bacterium]
IEAGIEGIPAIGFSLLDYTWDADFDSLSSFVKKITKSALKNKIPESTVLNVNFPKRLKGEIKGIKICRQANAYWIEEFDKRQDPMGKEYYWMTGAFINDDKGEDTDIWALENGYISVVPTHFDLTAHHHIQKLNSWAF